MKLGKCAVYALRAATALARARRPVTVADVARRHGLPATVLAKVLQQLVHAGIARGTRGARGGYRLARPAAAISALQVIELFGAPRDDTSVTTAARVADGDPLARLFREIDDTTRSTFASVSIATLAR